MQQYFTDQKLAVDMVLDMTKEQSHHISTVLRMKDGKNIRLVDATQSVFLGAIQINQRGVSVKIIQPISEVRESTVNFT